MNKQGDNYIVVQSNPLIESQYKLDLLPQKIIRYLVSRIKPEDKTFEDYVYRLSISDFKSMMGSGSEYTGSTIENIKAAAEKLLKTQITITRGEEVIRANWLASYKHHKQQAWFEFSFPVHLERELLNIKDQFTQYHLINISKLKSQYSIRIYELLKQYASIGRREISFDDLKKILGVEKKEYPLFGNFKAKVLAVAEREINQKTDLEYKWKPVKKVRKIVGVEFYDIFQKLKIPDSLLSLLPQKFRSSNDVLTLIRKWLELKDVDYVKEKILYTNSRKPTKYADYLFQCLEKDYGAGYDPAQAELPLEDEKTKISLQDGVKIQIGDVTYTIEEGVVRTESGLIPKGMLQQGVMNGEYRIIDV